MNIRKCSLAIIAILFAAATGYGQNHYQPIPLPAQISGVNEEFSGMTTWKNRVYLEPQYGSHKETMLDGEFYIYSISCDSIGRVVDRRDSALTAYRAIKVNNLQLLPDTVKKYYEGFEAITIVNGTVYLSIETNDTYDYCFLLKGRLDTIKNEISIDPRNFITLKRYPYIGNAGFESLTYLPREKKLIAMYEYNGLPSGGFGYLVDPSFVKPVKRIPVPFLYFRITDITATVTDKLYGINYYWNGDYDIYLNNSIQRHEESNIKTLVPGLKPLLTKDTAYLKEKTTCYARIVSLKGYKATSWKEEAVIECTKNNWEGITLYRKGALVVSDANRSSRQVTTLAYITF